MVQESLSENVGVECPWDLFDFSEEGRIHIQANLFRVFMRFRWVNFDIDDVLSLFEMLEE